MSMTIIEEVFTILDLSRRRKPLQHRKMVRYKRRSTEKADALLLLDTHSRDEFVLDPGFEA